MMGRKSGQMSMVILDLSELISENHLLRTINQIISFDFIYELVKPYYPANGRPSVDPVSIFKMLWIGYLYGIKSEHRLMQEVHWFYDIWSGRFKTVSQCKILHLIMAMIPAPSTVVWNC